MKTSHAIIGLTTLVVIIFAAAVTVGPHFMQTYKREQAINLLRQYGTKNTVAEKYTLIMQVADAYGQVLASEKASAQDSSVCPTLFNQIEYELTNQGTISDDRYTAALNHSMELKQAGCTVDSLQ